VALTDQDRETIELIASRVAEKFSESQAAAVQAMIDHHRDTCPHGRRLRDTRFFVIGGICVVLILVKDAAAALAWFGRLL
jgi:hypothetical protein